MSQHGMTGGSTGSGENRYYEEAAEGNHRFGLPCQVSWLVGLALTALFLSACTASPPSTSAQINSIQDDGVYPAYVITGGVAETYKVGQDLVVYRALDVPERTSLGVIREPIALLRVVSVIAGQGVLAQAILIDPASLPQPNMPVDNRIDDLARANLVPADPQAAGYFIDSTVVHLRPDQMVEVGKTLEALAPLVQDHVIVAYAPFQPPLLFVVTDLGTNPAFVRVDGPIAGLPPGTVVRWAQAIDTKTVTPSPDAPTQVGQLPAGPIPTSTATRAAQPIQPAAAPSAAPTGTSAVPPVLPATSAPVLPALPTGLPPTTAPSATALVPTTSPATIAPSATQPPPPDADRTARHYRTTRHYRTERHAALPDADRSSAHFSPSNRDTRGGAGLLARSQGRSVHRSKPTPQRQR